VSRAVGNQLSVAFVLSALGSLRHDQGKLDDAAALLDEAERLAGPHGTYHRYQVAGYRALLEMERGDLRAARAQLDVAAEKLERPDDADRFAYASFRIVLDAMEGRVEEADAALAELEAEVPEEAWIDRALVRAQRGHVHVARAESAPDDAERTRCLEAAGACLELLHRPGPGGRPAPVETYPEARLARRVLRAAVAPPPAADGG